MLLNTLNLVCLKPIVLDFTYTEFRDIKFTRREFPSVKTVFRSYSINNPCGDFSVWLARPLFRRAILFIPNQLGRRNLNPNQIAYLRGKRYEVEKKIITNKGGVNQFEVAGKNYPQAKNRSSEDLASEYGVSEKTN